VSDESIIKRIKRISIALCFAFDMHGVNNSMLTILGAAMTIVKRLSSSIILSLLSGCLLFIDTSVQARHNWWLESHLEHMKTHPNIYAPYWANRASGDNFVGSKTLPNGNIEDEYFDGLSDGRHKGNGVFIHNCIYFYEYEPKSGLIVNFRFEEKEKYDCRATGA
jgi:hypothetical protein